MTILPATFPSSKSEKILGSRYQYVNTTAVKYGAGSLIDVFQLLDFVPTFNLPKRCNFKGFHSILLVPT
jgi:hypothetical protein